MSGKIDDVELKGLPQELIDFKDRVSEVFNFGKYQFPIVTSPPTWTGRGGQLVVFVSGSTGRLYVAVSDGSTSWSKALEWTI